MASNASRCRAVEQTVFRAVDIVRPGEHAAMLVRQGRLRNRKARAPRAPIACRSSRRTKWWRCGRQRGEAVQDHAIDLGPVPGDALELAEAAEVIRIGIVPGGAAATNISFPAAARDCATGSSIMRLQDCGGAVVVAFRRRACGNRSRPPCGRRAPDGRSWPPAEARPVPGSARTVCWRNCPNGRPGCNGSRRHGSRASTRVASAASVRPI